jgi:hypothetical protein
MLTRLPQCLPGPCNMMSWSLVATHSHPLTAGSNSKLQPELELSRWRCLAKKVLLLQRKSFLMDWYSRPQFMGPHVILYIFPICIDYLLLWEEQRSLSPHMVFLHGMGPVAWAWGEARDLSGSIIDVDRASGDLLDQWQREWVRFGGIDGGVDGGARVACSSGGVCGWGLMQLAWGCGGGTEQGRRGW